MGRRAMDTFVPTPMAGPTRFADGAGWRPCRRWQQATRAVVRRTQPSQQEDESPRIHRLNFLPFRASNPPVTGLPARSCRSMLVGAFSLIACARGPATHAVAPPCAEAPASASTPAGATAPGDAIFMRASGDMHVFVLPVGSAPVHQFIRGLPANLALTEDAAAPTRITVLEPLRFEAITLFPPYYLTREVEYASPQVTVAAGTALHRVQRLDATRCDAYIGFSADSERRQLDFDGGEILGQYAPDLDVGPIEVPCDALGGSSDDPLLESSADDDANDDSEHALRLTPTRDEDGSEHYDALNLQLFEEPTEASASVSLEGSEDGAEILASSSVRLLEKRPRWKRIRLVINGAVAIQGWVAATEFEPDNGASQGSELHGRLGGYHRAGPTPTYCAGTLAAGTRIFSTSGVAWATAGSNVEAAFERKGARVYLVNFLGQYRDAFCSSERHATDTQGIAACLEDAEVRPADVTLRCPAGKN